MPVVNGVRLTLNVPVGLRLTFSATQPNGPTDLTDSYLHN